jgi:hypothetical protein
LPQWNKQTTRTATQIQNKSQNAGKKKQNNSPSLHNHLSWAWFGGSTAVSQGDGQGYINFLDLLVPMMSLDGPGEWVRISDTSYHLCCWGYHLSRCFLAMYIMEVQWAWNGMNGHIIWDIMV